MEEDAIESPLVRRLTQLAVPVVEGIGCELVELQFRREMSGWVLRLVIDKENGIGIDDEIKGKIFYPFFTTKAVGEGTGLGLAISYGIVQNHGGEIIAESRKGHGSTFRIRLPLGEKNG